MRKSSTKPEPVHALVLRLCDPTKIEFIHGRRITDVARRDLTRRFAAIARSVLRRHIPLGGPFTPELGVWLVPFRMKSGALAFDESEQASAITDAGMAQAREMLDSELGRAAAMHVDFRLGVLREDSGEADAARLYARLSARIARLEADWAPPAISRETFQKILSGPCLDFQLQPIVSLPDLRTVGFEALVRGPSGGPVERPDRLFAAASYYGLHRELDLACVGAALRRAGALPEPYWLSVNLGPDLFDPAVLRRLVAKPGALRRRVFEITEHLPIASPEKFADRARPLLRRGARVALDDAGCGYLDMGMVESFSPHIVKLCITVIRRISSGPASLRAIRDTAARIRRADAAPLAEGVETEEQLRLVRGCGFALAQGYLFGKPRPAREVLSGLAPHRRRPRPYS